MARKQRAAASGLCAVRVNLKSLRPIDRHVAWPMVRLPDPGRELRPNLDAIRFAALAGAISAAVRGSRSRGYLQILAVVSGARLFGLASQFVVLVILSRILPKDSFGDLMTAFGFYRLAGIALGVGPSLLLLFHISRRPHDQEAEVKLHRYSAMLGALVSGGRRAARLSRRRADRRLRSTSRGSRSGSSCWRRSRVFSTLLVVATGALEGRSRISESIVLGEVVPNAIRIALLPLVALVACRIAYVAHVLTLSVLLPWLWTARRLWNRNDRGHHALDALGLQLFRQVRRRDAVRQPARRRRYPGRGRAVLVGGGRRLRGGLAHRRALLVLPARAAEALRAARRPSAGDRRPRRAAARGRSLPAADHRLHGVHDLRNLRAGAVSAAGVRQLSRRRGAA